MKATPLIALLSFFALNAVFGEEAPKFDGSSFSSLTYEGKRLVEPRITSVDKNGVTLTDKMDKDSVTVPLDRALKQPEIRTRAKEAIEEAIKTCGDSTASPVTVNADQVTVNAKEVNVQTQGKDPSNTSTAQAGNEEPLSKSERAQMVQGVVWAKLVRTQSKARDLNDQELRDLYEKALPIIQLQSLQRGGGY